MPEATSILGAVKLTGRTAGGWAMGVLDAVTGEETARFRTVEGVDGEQVAERWEWRPGSTMYFTWQQTRSDFRPIGDFEFGRGVDSLFGAAPDNVFLIKISYWLNP